MLLRPVWQSIGTDNRAMTQPSKPTAAQKIARLRGIFLEQLPHRLEQIEQLRQRLEIDSHDPEILTDLHRTVHSLKGTGRTFGFQQLGEAADQAEQMLGERLANPDTDESTAWLRRLQMYLQELKQDAEAILSTGDTEPDSDEPFDLSAYRPFWPTQDCRGKLLYICDDDPLVVDQLSIQLTCFGYQAATFTELDQLGSSLVENRPDALIMDINFPEGRYAGSDLVGSLRSRLDYQLPVIFLSSRDDFDARLSAVLAGGTDYFAKPANIQELVASLDRLTCQNGPEPYRVLIVDDESTIADYHCLILQEAGMMTHAIHEPHKILTALHEFRPDLVLMDMYMPTCSGYDLAKLIRQVHEYTAVPIIYLSSETDKQKQFSAMRIGAEGFMTKPVIPGELVAAVEIRAERMRSLRSLMVRDSLTGLFNHTTTTQLLEAALSNTRRSKSQLCLVMIDIDHFKQVNDTHGHPAGDQVLLALARVMKQRLRISDIIGRYGGEEFALVMLDVDINKAAELIDNLRESFAQLRFNAKQTTFSCTFSAGIASFPKFSRLEKLREAADQALYRAKNAGRNCIQIA